MCHTCLSGCIVFITPSSAFCAHHVSLMGWMVSMSAPYTSTVILYRQYLILFMIVEPGFLGRLILSLSGSDSIRINISDVLPKSVTGTDLRLDLLPIPLTVFLSLLCSTNCLLELLEEVTNGLISWLLSENAFLRLFYITFVLCFLADCAFDVVLIVYYSFKEPFGINFHFQGKLSALGLLPVCHSSFA